MTSKLGGTGISAFILFAVVLSATAVSESITAQMDLASYFHVVGRFLGLFAYLIFAMQYVWTAKVKVIERLLPYDRRVAIHRTFGFLGITAVTLHPILVLGALAAWGVGLSLSLPILLGAMAFLLLLLVGASTFLSRIWGVRYEVWKRIHWITFAVLTLAFAHSMQIGGDVHGLFRVFWIALYGLHVLILLSKFTHKIVSWSRHYRISAVDESGPNVRTLHFDTPRRSHHPGQFTFVSLHIDGRWSQWHPFSITSTGTEDSLTVAIKAVGDFTGSIGQVKPGDPAKVDSGYGGFSPVFALDSRYVMIAGGIGIAPIYGILKHLRQLESPPEVVLLYTVHHESDIIFRDELDQWFDELPDWKQTYVVTSQPDWTGETGRLTPDRAIQLCNNSTAGTFFLCGPSPMVRGITRHLRSLGVPSRRIRRELFEFLP